MPEQDNPADSTENVHHDIVVPDSSDQAILNDADVDPDAPGARPGRMVRVRAMATRPHALAAIAGAALLLLGGAAGYAIAGGGSGHDGHGGGNHGDRTTQSDRQVRHAEGQGHGDARH